MKGYSPFLVIVITKEKYYTFNYVISELRDSNSHSDASYSTLLSGGAMFVAEVMSKEITTVFPEENIVTALRVMVQNNIRHLPVTDSKNPKKLIGFITGHDVKRGLNNAEEAKKAETQVLIQDIMQKEITTVTTHTYIQDAARLMFERRIGGLPVVSDGELVGIITSHDVLGIFIEIMDGLQESARIDVEISKNDDLEAIRLLLEEEGCEILGIGLLPETDSESIYSFRIKHQDTMPLHNLLLDAGFKVIEHFC